MDFLEERYFTNFHGALQTIMNAQDFPLFDIEQNSQHIEAGLERFYKSNNNIEEGLNYLLMKIEATKEFVLNDNLSNISDKVESLNYLEEMVFRVFKVAIEPKGKLKLHLNADKDVIFHLLRQLKNLYVRPGVPFLSQNYETIARFLIENVEGFDKNKVKNLEKELTKSKSDLEKRRIKVSLIKEGDKDEETRL